MADPSDKSGGSGPGDPAPGPVPPAVPAIPRLTPAVPEQVAPAPDPPPAAATPVAAPPLGSVPPVAPLVTAVPKVAPVTRPAAPGRPAPRTPTSSSTAIPVVPAIAPVLGGGAAAPRPPPLPFPKAAAAPPGPLSGNLGPLELAELERRWEVLDQLDYFEVMGLELGASPLDIKRAFHHESRTYHPDRFFQTGDENFKAKVHALYKRVTEAYFVLRDDARRKKYLADITGPDRHHKLRFDELAEAEAKAAVKKEVAEQIGTHPKGRQFFQVGLADLESGRLSSAERNIKLALTYEPANPLYKQKLEEAQAKLYEEYKRSGKGFRIE